jgi:uncharacterized protein
VELSGHNIIGKITNSESYFIINPLSGHADILTKDEYELLNNNSFSDPEPYLLKGYLVDPIEEKKLYHKKYLEFLDRRDNDEIQIFYVPDYKCNFACSYCYQDQYQHSGLNRDKKVLREFFRHIETHFAGRKKYLTLFGGEPLINSKAQKSYIAEFIRLANLQQLQIAVVTNGYHLVEYIDLLKSATIREVQVTLDGLQDMHNSRRPLKNGSPTFDKIVEGIDAALKEGFPVNLRIVLDKENIKELPKLARFAIDKGWTNNLLFKTQLGRNYELHHCQLNHDLLYSRIGLYQAIYRMIRSYPEILIFHRPAFSISRFLFDNGELPEPLFDSCPGTKTEWAFDSSGRIYSCTATVGKEGEELGTFFPESILYHEKISEWEKRDVLTIDGCKSCSLKLVCGGGCASVVKSQTGNINSPDCRPVTDFIGLGFSAYFIDQQSESVTQTN